MALNSRKHLIPAGSDTSVSRATIFETFANSIRDIVPVANTTERDQLVTALTTAGQGPSATSPIYVYRADAPGLHRVECSVDGVVWVPASGVLSFSSKANADTWATSNGSYLAAGDLCRVGVREYRWSGSAWRASRAAFFVNRSSGQSLNPAGWWVVSSAFGTPGLNDVGTWNGPNGTLQVAHAGIYRVNGFVKLAAAQNPMSMQITQNSSAPDANVLVESFINSSASSLNAGAVASLNANDVLRLLVFNSTVTTVSAAQLSVELIQYT